MNGKRAVGPRYRRRAGYARSKANPRQSFLTTSAQVARYSAAAPTYIITSRALPGAPGVHQACSGSPNRSFAGVDGVSAPALQGEDPARVAGQEQLARLFIEAQPVEVIQCLGWGDHRVVAAEQHLPAASPA